jgi:hypothetical protein
MSLTVAAMATAPAVAARVRATAVCTATILIRAGMIAMPAIRTGRLAAITCPAIDPPGRATACRCPGSRRSVSSGARAPRAARSAAAPATSAASTTASRIVVARRSHSDLRALHQAVRTVDDDAIIIGKPAKNIGHLIGDNPDLHRLQVHS